MTAAIDETMTRLVARFRALAFHKWTGFDFKYFPNGDRLETKTIYRFFFLFARCETKLVKCSPNKNKHGFMFEIEDGDPKNDRDRYDRARNKKTYAAYLKDCKTRGLTPDTYENCVKGQ